MKKIALFVVIAFIFAICVGCSAKQKLIGDWTMGDGTAVVTFNNDGSCRFAIGGFSAGKQSYIVKDKEIVVTNTILGITQDITMPFNFSDSGNTLTLTFSGKELKLQRKK